jgi:hypothetical protein
MLVCSYSRAKRFYDSDKALRLELDIRTIHSNYIQQLKTNFHMCGSSKLYDHENIRFPPNTSHFHGKLQECLAFRKTIRYFVFFSSFSKVLISLVKH